MSDSLEQTKKPICKNCIHFKWTEQLCKCHLQYLEDDDTCDEFKSTWDEVEITESDIGNADFLFRNNSSDGTKTDMQKTMEKLPQTIRDSPHP